MDDGPDQSDDTTSSSPATPDNGYPRAADGTVIPWGQTGQNIQGAVNYVTTTGSLPLPVALKYAPGAYKRRVIGKAKSLAGKVAKDKTAVSKLADGQVKAQQKADAAKVQRDAAAQEVVDAKKAQQIAEQARLRFEQAQRAETDALAQKKVAEQAAQNAEKKLAASRKSARLQKENQQAKQALKDAEQKATQAAAERQAAEEASRTATAGADPAVARAAEQRLSTAESELARAEGVITRGAPRVTRAVESSAKLATKSVVATEIAEGAGKGFLGGAARLLGKAAFVVAVGMSIRDIYKGYEAGGVKGALSAAGDTASTFAGGFIGAEGGAWAGAAVGAAIGSVVPVVGTAIGGAIGFVGGLVGGYLGAKYIAPHIKSIGAWAIHTATNEGFHADWKTVKGFLKAAWNSAPNATDEAAQDQQQAGTQPTNGSGNQQQQTGTPPVTNPNDPNYAPARVAISTPVASVDDILAAANKGEAIFGSDSATLSTDQTNALLNADRITLRQIADAKHTRSHAKINLPDGEVVDFDGTKGGKIAIEVDGHASSTDTTSNRSMTMQQLRAETTANVLRQAVHDEGLDGDVTITSKRAGAGQGDTPAQQRNATFKLVGTGM